MKNLMYCVIIGSLLFVNTVQAKTYQIIETFDNVESFQDVTNIEPYYSGSSVKKYLLDTDHNIPVILYHETTSLQNEPEIRYSESTNSWVLYTGSSTLNMDVHFQHFTGLEYYFTEEPLKALSLSIDYYNEGVRGGRLVLALKGYENGVKWSKNIRLANWESVINTGWNTFTFSEEEILEISEGRSISNVKFYKFDITNTTYGGKSLIDNVVINATDYEDIIASVDPVELLVEKEGNYTAIYNDTIIPMTVEVDGEEVLRNPENGFIGYLYPGQIIHITIDGEEASDLYVNDYNPTQSWDLYFAEAGISIHVEDPPMCSDTELEATYTKGYTDGEASVICPINTVEVIVEVPIEVPVIEYVNVTVEVPVEIEVIKYVDVPVEKIVEVEVPMTITEDKLLRLVVDFYSGQKHKHIKKFLNRTHKTWKKENKQRKQRKNHRYYKQHKQSKQSKQHKQCDKRK